MLTFENKAFRDIAVERAVRGRRDPDQQRDLRRRRHLRPVQHRGGRQRRGRRTSSSTSSATTSPASPTSTTRRTSRICPPPIASSRGSRTRRRCSIPRALKWKDLRDAGRQPADAVAERGVRDATRRRFSSGAARSAPRTGRKPRWTRSSASEEKRDTALLERGPARREGRRVRGRQLRGARLLPAAGRLHHVHARQRAVLRRLPPRDRGDPRPLHAVESPRHRSDTRPTRTRHAGSDTVRLTPTIASRQSIPTTTSRSPLRFLCAAGSRDLSLARDAFLYCFLLLITLSTSAIAQTSHTVNGIVRDPAGGTISGAEIQILGARQRLVGAATTDAQGRFSLTVTEAGSYVLEIRAPGFADTRTSISIPLASERPLELTTGMPSLHEDVSVTASVDRAEPTTRLTQPVNVIDSNEIQLRAKSVGHAGGERGGRPARAAHEPGDGRHLRPRPDRQQGQRLRRRRPLLDGGAARRRQHLHGPHRSRAPRLGRSAARSEQRAVRQRRARRQPAVPLARAVDWPPGRRPGAAACSRRQANTADYGLGSNLNGSYAGSRVGVIGAFAAPADRRPPRRRRRRFPRGGDAVSSASRRTC